MTQDEYEVGSLEDTEEFAIIRMAREAELYSYLWGGDINQQSLEALERFAALVAAHERDKFLNKLDGVTEKVIYEIVKEAVLAEREACAKVCEKGVDTEHPIVKGHIMKNFGISEHLAASIRARSEKK